MKKEKLIKYSSNNPLGWSEEDFRDVICRMVNIRILTGNYVTPLLNAYYLNESEQWHRDKVGMNKEYEIKQIQGKINMLTEELKLLKECENDNR